MNAADRKHAFVLVLIFTATFASVNVMPTFASTTDSWTSKASMLQPTGSNSIGMAALEGRIYAAAPAGTAPVRLEVYDPVADTWTQKANIPSEFRLHAFESAMVACQGKLYIIDGARGLTVSYDPATDSWENRTSMPTEVDSVRWGMQANAVDGKIYTIGGHLRYSWTDYDKILQGNEVYDPVANKWSELAPIPIGVTRYASTVIDDKIYIIGGAKTTETTAAYNLTKRSAFTNLVQVYDTKTDQWINETPLPIKMTAMAASATTGVQAPKRIYVTGGIPANETGDPLYDEHEFYLLVNWMQVYNPETKSWSNATSMPTARSDLCLVNVNDKLYALGGVEASQQYSTVNEMYTPADYGLATPAPTESPLNPVFPAAIAMSIVLAASILFLALKKKRRKQQNLKERV